MSIVCNCPTMAGGILHHLTGCEFFLTVNTEDVAVDLTPAIAAAASALATAAQEADPLAVAADFLADATVAVEAAAPILCAPLPQSASLQFATTRDLLTDVWARLEALAVLDTAPSDPA